MNLEAWVHFIPVREDLSDLVETAKWVADPQNDPKVKDIIKAANEWCHTKMTVTQFAVDTLWTLLSYASVLQEGGDSNTIMGGSWLSKWETLSQDYAWVPAEEKNHFFEPFALK
jgi:hypothetical protein